MKLMECFASFMVCFGVILIAAGRPSAGGGIESMPAFLIGVTVLTIGVRLAIDCGKGRPSE